ncbi:MAG: PD40 domain-containing protein [Mojavia pulchra JT2-VF2]|jgi:WD40 repeat protein|uniref:PD40 domain-containing protein n=1 Tax=Mojavia pulchra JT2-VF2 TaxID=287848 RepID=A0A951Q0I4_9NOST|nr:PD40 domain-containing protein [Mojavia pulchra JT2-VF2]
MKVGTQTFALSLLLTIYCSAIASGAALRAIAQVPSSSNLTAIENVQAANPTTVAKNKSWQNARLVHTLPSVSGYPILSPDSQILAAYRRGEQKNADNSVSQTNENIITLTNINTGKIIHNLTYRSPSEIKSLVFSPDGRILATQNYHQGVLTIKLWNVATGEEIQTLRRIVKPKRIRGTGSDPSENSVIAFNPDGNSLISFSGGNPTIQVWNATAKPIAVKESSNLAKLTPLLVTQQENSPTQPINKQIQESVAKDRQRYPDDEVLDYDIVTDALDAGKNFFEIQQLLIQQSKMVQRWRKTEAKNIYQAKTNYYVNLITKLQTISYIHLRTRLILDEFGTNTSEGKQEFKGQGYLIESSNNNYLVADSNSNIIIMQIKDGSYDLNTNPSFQDVTQIKLLISKLLNQGSFKFNLTGHTDEITSFAFSPNGQILASASADKTIKLWNLKTGKLLNTIKGNNAYGITQMAVNPNNQVLVTAGTEENAIRMWDLKTGKIVRKIAINGFANSIRFSKDGNQLLIISNRPFDSMQVEVWNAKNGKLIHRGSAIGASKNTYVGIDISPDGETYAVTGEGSYLPLQVRDLMTDKTIVNFGKNEDWVFYTKDSNTLVTGGREGIKIWQ